MKINILVNFMNIYNNFDCIDGTNINYPFFQTDNNTNNGMKSCVFQSNPLIDLLILFILFFYLML